MLHAAIRTEPLVKDARGAVRRTLHLAVEVGSVEDAQPAVVLNLSQTGLLVDTAAKLVTGDRLEVVLPEIGATSAIVMWSRGDRHGCSFVTPIPRAVVSAAQLRSSAEAASSETPGVPAEPVVDRSRARSPNFPLMIGGLTLLAVVVGAVLIAAYVAG
jgi:hypothetical protein